MKLRQGLSHADSAILSRWNFLATQTDFMKLNRQHHFQGGIYLLRPSSELLKLAQEDKAVVVGLVSERGSPVRSVDTSSGRKVERFCP